MNTFVVVINQDDWWQRSFNVLVPLSIQGNPCRVIAWGEAPTLSHGSTSALIEVDSKRYSVPNWAVEVLKKENIGLTFDI